MQYLDQVYVGIDPGKTGAITVITSIFVKSYPMPLIGKELDIDAISNIFCKANPTIIVIEKQQYMLGKKAGGVATFTSGKNYGILLGLAKQYRVEIVTPQAWKKVILKDTAKDKQAAIDYCINNFPNLSLLRTPRCKKPHDGIADSICIAEYGRQTFSV